MFGLDPDHSSAQKMHIAIIKIRVAVMQNRRRAVLHSPDGLSFFVPHTLNCNTTYLYIGAKGTKMIAALSDCLDDCTREMIGEMIGEMICEMI